MRTLKICSVLLAMGLIGCAVHDGHEDEPAPIWWPAFLYRPTTHPTEEEYDQTDASPALPPQVGTAVVS